MNIYESITNNLKEAYEVDVNNKQLKDSALAFVRRMSAIYEKYITKEVIQAIYKVYKASAPDYLAKYVVDNNEEYPDYIKVFKLSTGEPLYLYGPIRIIDYVDDLEVGGSNFITVEEPANMLDGAPFDEYPNAVFISIDDGGISIRYSLEGYPEAPTKGYKDNLVAMLEIKEQIFSFYKNVCMEISNKTLSLANEMSTNREKDIANKQREVANILKY